MPMDTTRVDTGSAQTGSTDIQETAAVAAGLIGRLDGYLANTMWMGQASTACANAITSYQEFSNRLHEVLNNVGVDVGTAGENHETNDHDQGSAMERIAASMNDMVGIR